MEFKDNKLIVKDESGNVIASEGDELTLSGGGIPHSWESEEYRQLNYNIPGDCYPSYWIVGE
jgi:hypothetical protein